MTEKRKVLFVDDEEDILRSIRRVVRKEPYEAVFAESGKTALELVAAEKIHVIVTDLNMPEMDGLELLSEVEATYPEIIRVILSGHGDSVSILDSMILGNIYRYIIKPWENLELRLTVRQSIDMFNLQQEKRDLLMKLENQNKILENEIKKRTVELMAIKSGSNICSFAEPFENLNNYMLSINNVFSTIEPVIKSENPDIEKLKKFHGTLRESFQKLEKDINTLNSLWQNNTAA